MGAMGHLTKEDMRKLTVAQTNALCHWLRISYGSKTGTTIEKRKRIWRRIRDEEARHLLRHMWKAVVENLMAETVLAFDRKIIETGPRTPLQKDTVEVSYLSLICHTAVVSAHADRRLEAHSSSSSVRVCFDITERMHKGYNGEY